MMIARACALAAIYVREGAPRDLALSRRGKLSGTPISPSGALALKFSRHNPRGTQALVRTESITAGVIVSRT
jgi:hypothetical protein